MLKLIIILIATIAGLKQVEAKCNECNSYEIACIDEKRFRVCENGKIDESTTLECGADEICTDLSLVCVPKSSSTAKPACVSLCGVCDTGQTFACTSRTTYALCKDGKTTNVTGSCPTSKVCDTGTSVCISPCDATPLKCDKDAVTTTIAPPTPTLPPSSPSPPVSPTPSPPVTNSTTPSTPTRTPAEVCAAKGTPGRFSYDDNDNRCTPKYVYCRYQGSTLVGIPNTCPTGSYFHKDEQSCGTNRPAGCVDTIPA